MIPSYGGWMMFNVDWLGVAVNMGRNDQAPEI
jgi:hypothetical protein